MKKPSERIEEIAEQMVNDHKAICTSCGSSHHPPTSYNYRETAIIQYLEEEWEKKYNAQEEQLKVK